MNEAIDVIADVWTGLQASQFDVLQRLGFWNYVVLALLVCVEGPIVTLLGAAAAATGMLQLKLVFAAAMVGNVAADVLWYLLGYLGRVEWAVRYGKWFGVRREHVTRLQRGITRHAWKILVIAKLSLSLVIPALVAVGLARVPWRRWFPVLVIAESIWTGTLVLLGFYATESIRQIERGVHQVALVSSAAILVLLLVWTLRRQLDFLEVEASTEHDTHTYNEE